MATLTRRGNVVDLLQHQHVEIRKQFLRAALPGRGRRGAFDRLVRMLALHEAAEEAHVRSKARHALDGGKALVAARRGGKKSAKKLLHHLWCTGPYGKGYGCTLLALRRTVLGHAAHEEREEFPALRARPVTQTSRTGWDGPRPPHPSHNEAVSPREPDAHGAARTHRNPEHNRR